MIRQIFCSLLVLLFFASCENRYRKGRASTTASASVDPKFVGKTSDDAYQVSASEYDKNFVSRYGLLYLKASNEPFSGRILTVDMGENGEFVSSDEAWREGKKHGKSSKWFSNGIKMYERNYQEGRWHGSVTRWWPNGQKMYVRAYTNGVRHGSEATWRSDGTPLSLPANGTPTIEKGGDSFDTTDSLPGVDLDSSPALPDTVIEPTPNEFIPSDPVIAEEPAPLGLPDPLGQPSEENAEEEFSDLPAFPPMDEEGADFSSEVIPPSLPNNDEDNTLLPPASLDFPSDEVIPPLSPEDSPDALPSLPGLEEADTSVDSAPLPLPGLPDDNGGLPPLPGMDDDGGLPPLPGGGDDSFGELPPLPPLP